MSSPRPLMSQLDDARKKVDVDTYNVIVREILGMTSRKELHRAPEYQRKFRWKPDAESRLVESFLLGLPVPSIFVATNSDGSWEVVDGLQRVSTLIHFVSDDSAALTELGKTEPLRLEGLRTLSTFNGLTYQELPPAIQAAFMKRGILVTALSDKSDPRTRYDTFERLNRGAVELTPQEIRACVLDGPFNKMLRELSLYPPFKKLVKLQKADEVNATREELVLKYFAYSYDRENFRGAVDAFLTNYMESQQHVFDVQAGELEFRAVIDVLAGVVQGPFLRSNTNITPKSELEGVMVAIGDILRKKNRVGSPAADWLDDVKLVEASTRATNTKKKLAARIERATELLTSSVG